MRAGEEGNALQKRNSFLHQLLNFDILMALQLFTPQSVCHKHKRRYNEKDGHRKGWFLKRSLT